jgi:RNA polymerase sigma-70 factor (ECF subfamily)
MAEKDQTLVRRTLAGDANAFGDLVERYTRLVRGVVWETVRRPDEVEDLVQEAFCKAYEQLPSLRQPARFAAWLWSIAANAALSHQYRKQREGRLAAAGAAQPAALSLYLRRPDEAAEAHEAASLVWEALDRLEPESRRLVVLYYFEGCGYQEIARFLDLSIAAVRWRLFRTRDWLRGELLGKLGAEIQVPVRSQRRMREKVMAALPVGLFLAPQPRSRLERWAGWQYWALGTAAGLGIVGLVYRAFQEPEARPSREALRLEREARLHSEPAIEWDPPQPRAGQRVRIRVEDLEVKEGEQAELHYITDPTYSTTDQVVLMHPEGGIWGVDLEIPEDAPAIFFYVAPRREGPQNLFLGAYLATQKKLKRYNHSLLVHDEAGAPVRDAFHARAVLAQRQDQPVEEVLAWVDREIALYPDHFRAYLTRWQTSLKAGKRSPEALAQVRAEQQALAEKYPDRPEALWWATRVSSDWQDTFLQAIYDQFPGHEYADAAAYQKATRRYFNNDTTGFVADLEDFIRRFPGSPYVDEIYRHYLGALSRVAPERAVHLADSLITHALVLPYDPQKEQGQQTFSRNPGGALPEGYAYSLRFDLYLKEGEQEQALALAERLIHSGLRDPLPYLYIGQKLAGQEGPSLGFFQRYPRDLSLAAQLLEAGLVWATPENLLELPGFNTYFAAPAQGWDWQRRYYLDQAHAQRQIILIALAECYLAGEEYERTVPHLEESAVLRDKIKTYFLTPDRTFSLLGKAYEHTGEWGKAEQTYLRAVAQDYSHPEAEAALQRLHLARYGHLEKLKPLLLACYPQAPEFTLRDTLGQEVRLADFRGKVLLLYYDSFMHTDTSQIAEAGRIRESLAKRVATFRDRGLEVLHVCRSPGLQYSPFRLALDDDGVEDKYQFSIVGSVGAALIDRQGRLRLRQGRWPFAREAVAESLWVQEKIEELLQEGGEEVSLAEKVD